MRKHRAGHLRLAASALTALMLMSTVGPLLPTARVLAAEADAGTGTWPQADEALQTGDIAIDETNFPDEKFREIVKSKCDTDNNGSLSPEEIAACTSINIYSDVKNLKGIEFFSELTSLICRELTLTEIDLSNNKKLEQLTVESCKLTNLDVSQNQALKSLDCSGNLLSSLDVSGNVALTGLSCRQNQLKELNISKNVNLRSLSCAENQLKELNISKNVDLSSLS